MILSNYNEIKWQMIAVSPLYLNTTQKIQTNHNHDYDNEDHYTLYSKGD